jgi:hypothetical protein
MEPANCQNIPSPPHTGLLSFTYFHIYEDTWRLWFSQCPEETMEAFKLSDEEKTAVKKLAQGEGSDGIGFAAQLLHTIYEEINRPAVAQW